MKKVLLLPFLLIINFINGHCQYIDSSFVQYHSNSQELVCYVDGQLAWLDIDFIVAINDNTNSDTVFIDVHFSPCQIYNTFMPYDTTFYVNRALSSGSWIVKFTTILNQDLDTTSCRYFPINLRVDSTFHNLLVPIGIQENRSVKYTVSPNPVQSVLYLDIPAQEKIVVIKISDAFGRDIKTPELENGRIDVSHLPGGLYFISIITPQGLNTTRFLKVNN